MWIQMKKMDELLNQTSTGRKRLQNEPLWLSKIDVKYAYSQLNSSEETSKHCKFALTVGNMNGYYSFKKDSFFYPMSRQFSKQQ